MSDRRNGRDEVPTLDSGGPIGLAGRPGSGELSLLDPIGPPPSVVRANGDWRRVLLPALGCQVRRLRGGHRMRDPAKDITLWLLAPAGVSSEISRSCSGRLDSTI